MNEQLRFLDQDRVKEFWLFLKTELAKKANMTDLDDYITDEIFTNALATALANYPTKNEVNAALAGSVKREIVDELPSKEDGDPTVIYFVPASGETDDENIKDEYMLINGEWEKIGTTRIDLSGYWSKNELRSMTSEELTKLLV